MFLAVNFRKFLKNRNVKAPGTVETSRKGDDGCTYHSDTYNHQPHDNYYLIYTIGHTRRVGHMTYINLGQ